MEKITTVGLDLAKQVIVAHEVGADGDAQGTSARPCTALVGDVAAVRGGDGGEGGPAAGHIRG